MEIATAYYSASGRSYNDCCFLGMRYNKEWGYKPREGECWVITARQGVEDTTDFSLPIGSSDWFTACWLSDNNILYVTSADRKILRNTRIIQERGLGPDSFETFDVYASLSGIWGLNDECVFAWGQRYADNWRYPVFHWNGKEWREIAALGFNVLSMHGIAPDCIYAAGYDGGMALWNGKEWQLCQVPVAERFTSVFVAAADEIYAVGVNNFVMQSNGKEWKIITQWHGYPNPLSAVVKWNSELWIGAGAFGLLKRVGNTDQLEVIKANVHAIGFDARHDLVITCRNVIVSTPNGIDFKGSGRDVLLKQREGKALNEN